MKKKTKISQESAKNRIFWTKFSKWLSLGFLFIGAIVSMVFGSLEISKKNGNSNISEFGDSYNIRHTTNLKIDSGEASRAPNYNDILINGNGYLTDNEKAKQIADVYQKWLYDNNIYNTGVQYSLNQSKGQIDIESNIYNLSKIKWSWDYSDDLKSQYLSDIFFNNTSNSFLDVIKYNKSYNKPTDGANANPLSGSEKYFNGQKVFTSAGLDLKSAYKYNKSDFSNSSSESYTNITDGVVINTSGSENILLNDFVALKKNINEINASSSSNGSDSSDETIPSYATDYKWYIFKDLSKLIKRLNYVQMVCIWNELLNQANANNNIDLFDTLTSNNSLPGILTFPGLTKYDKVTYLQKGLYESLSSDEKTWGDEVAKVVTNRGTMVWINDTNILDLYNHTITDITADVFNGGRPDKDNKQEAGYFSTSIDNIISSYVISEITYDNYTEFFPQSKILNDKNPNSNPDTTNDITANKVRFSYSSSLFSRINETNESRRKDESVNLIKNGISVLPSYVNRDYKINESQYTIYNDNKRESINALTTHNLAQDAWKGITSSFQSYTYPGEKILKNSITGMSAYNSLFLASGIILFMIAIFISVFYRVPGVFGSFAIIASTVLATSLNFIIGLTFSFATTLAIFAGIILGVSSVVILMERIRKNMKEGMSVFDSSDNSLRKSFMQVIDTHVASILIGLGLSFLGQGQTLDFGFQLILSSAISLACMFIFFYLYILEFVKEPLSWKGKLFYQKLSLGKIYSNKITSFTSTFSWKKSLTISSIFLSIFVIVIILVFTVGVQNSTTYNEGTSLYIYQNISSSEAQNISNKLGFGWSVISNNQSFTLIQSTLTINNSTIESILNNYSISDYIIARSTISIPLFEAKSNMYAVLASSGFVAAYILVRHGMFAIIPVFISTVFGFISGMCFEYILFLPINSFFTYTSIFIFVLLNIISISVLNVMRSRFNKKEIFSIKDITEFFTRNNKNMKNYFIIILSVIFVSSCILMLFGSISLIFSYLSILVNSLFAVTTTIAVFNILYYGSITLRQKYLTNIIHNAIENRSSKYDYVDEELVKGINQF